MKGHSRWILTLGLIFLPFLIITLASAATSPQPPKAKEGSRPVEKVEGKETKKPPKAPPVKKEPIKFFWSTQGAFTMNSINYHDDVARQIGARDLSRALFLGRLHREWEATQPLPRPLNTFLMRDHSAATFKGRMESVLDLFPDFTAGLQVDLYGRDGDRRTGEVWGVTPSFTTNTFTGEEENLAVNNFWVRNHSRNLLLTLGTFRPFHLSDYAFKGEPNPTLLGPDYLQLYGIDLAKRFLNPFFVPEIVYEGFFARLAQDSPYRTRLGAIYIGKEYERGKIGLNFLSAYNDGKSASLIPFPSQGFGPDIRGRLNLPRLGPQREELAGLDASYNLAYGVKLFGTIAGSIYRPNKKHGHQVYGTLFNLGASANLLGTDLTLEYLSVDPDYDPFILPIEDWKEVQQPGFHELPYFTTYAGTYQLHDTKKFPNNRQGLRFHLDWPIPGQRSFGNIYLSYEFLRQKDSSLGRRITQRGFREPFFGLADLAGSGDKGDIQGLEGGINYQLPRNMRLALGLSYWDFQRDGGPQGTNKMDFRAEALRITFGYPLLYTLKSKIYLDSGYAVITGKGSYLSSRGNLDFIQNSPFIALSYKFTDPPDVLRYITLKYTFYYQQDHADPHVLGDFDNNQILLEVGLDF